MADLGVESVDTEIADNPVQAWVSGAVEMRADAAPDSRARRSIVLAPTVVEALRRWKVRQLKERLLPRAKWQETGHVFASSIGTPLEPRRFHGNFDAAVQRVGLPPIRVHDRRHTCTTMLLSQGVHPKVVQELLGHSQISLTLDTYSHVLPTMQEEAARMLESVLAIG
jgi:integrase